jgi:hypothetical protein
MKNKASFLANLFLASALLWGAPAVEAEELILKEVADPSSYCHMKFPEMRPETLSWEVPVLGTDRIVDFYGPCDHDPTGIEEIKTQRRLRFDGVYGGGGE